MLFALVVWPGSVLAADCAGRSGERTTALVELYTGRDCAGCPPANRWLSALSGSYRSDQVVPLALQVDYADYSGGKPEVFRRKQRLLAKQRLALVYTPQVMVQGSDFRSWATADFGREVARITAQPARADLELRIVSVNADSLAVRARAGSAAPDAALFVATYKSYVVLEWRGPYGLGEHEFRLPLLPQARPADSGVVAFVQDRRTTEVLQTLMLGVCSS